MLVNGRPTRAISRPAVFLMTGIPAVAAGEVDGGDGVPVGEESEPCVVGGVVEDDLADRGFIGAGDHGAGSRGLDRSCRLQDRAVVRVLDFEPLSDVVGVSRQQPGGSMPAAPAHVHNVAESVSPAVKYSMHTAGGFLRLGVARNDQYRLGEEGAREDVFRRSVARRPAFIVLLRRRGGRVIQGAVGWWRRTGHRI